MSLSKLNATCELINSIRNSILQDEQRSVNETKDGTKPPPVKRQFTQPELSQIGSCVAELAGSAPEIATLIGAIVSDFIPLDHRGVAVYDYVGCALFHARRHADALLVWHQAARAEAVTSSSSSSTSASDMPLRPRVGRRTKGGSTAPAAEKSKEETKSAVTNGEDTKSKLSSGDDAKSKPSNGEDAKSKSPDEEAKSKALEEAKSKALEESRKKLSETHRSLTHIRENMFHALGSIVVPPIVSSDLKPLHDVMGGEVQKTSWHASAIPAPYHISNPCIIAHPTDTTKKISRRPPCCQLYDDG